MEKTIIFDMDGVLIDSERLVLNCWNYYAGKHNIQDMEETFYRCIGVNKMETKKILLERYGEDFPFDDFREECNEILEEKIKEKGMPVKAGARELLSFLKINGYRIGLASSTRKVRIYEHLEKIGMLGFFEVIVAGDMVEKSKPEPDIYLKACELMQVAPENAYAVEDSRNGLLSACRAGMKVFLVPDMIAADTTMEEMAYETFEDLVELRTFLADEGAE